MHITDTLGKDAEKKIQEWLDRPEEGYCFDRIPDQLTGFYGSKNICDFTLFKSPYMYYIESKATWNDRFDFSMITEYQHDNLLEKSKIENVYGIIILLFATYKRAFWIDINEIKKLEDSGKHSLNINKIDKWGIQYQEITTVPNNRKKLLDYNKENNII
jgi:penicillin-binding protein-related factor A (putative recombinase)